jgi:anti-sigma28 factor (negative regulator of flagellin synthesis)
MSTTSQKPADEVAMNIAARDNRQTCELGAGSGGESSAPAARLQAIHDLIRSGDYHVPANAIAERMIERMLTDRRSRRL